MLRPEASGRSVAFFGCGMRFGSQIGVMASSSGRPPFIFPSPRKNSEYTAVFAVPDLVYLSRAVRPAVGCSPRRGSPVGCPCAIRQSLTIGAEVHTYICVYLCTYDNGREHQIPSVTLHLTIAECRSLSVCILGWGATRLGDQRKTDGALRAISICINSHCNHSEIRTISIYEIHLHPRGGRCSLVGN
jgi:hypothetical protein